MKIITGKVISKKMNKTATVLVERIVMHPVYKKRFKRRKKYQVYDEFGVSVGDVVNFVACRPVSKLKRWKVLGHEKNRGEKNMEESRKKSSKELAKKV